MPTGTIIENPNKSSSKAVRITALAHYEHDKAIYTGSRNFQFDGFKTQIAEMISLANEAVKSKDPIDHYVVSWQEGELPSPAQIEECVDILLEELGLQGCQVLYGLHDDTDNIHFHFAVNKVDPETGKVRRVNNGFTAEAIQRAAAIIGHRQNWAPVPNARYEVLENGDCVRVKEDEDAPARPDKKTLDRENRTGIKSAKTIAIEEAAPIIQNATSWQQLHADLSAKGFRFEKVGSGAIIFIGETAVKASDASRGKTSLGAVQKRLGIYEPATQKEPNVYYTHEPLADYSDVPRPLTQKRLQKLSERRLVQNEQGPVSDRVLQDIPRDDNGRDGNLRRIPAAADNGGTGNSRPIGESRFGSAAGADERGRRSVGAAGRNDGRDRNSGSKVNAAVDFTTRPAKQISPDQVALHAEYARMSKSFYKDRDEQKQAIVERHGIEKSVLAGLQKTERQSVLGGNWKGVGRQKNAMSKFLKGKHVGQKLTLKDQQHAEMAAHRKKFKKLPSFEEWLRKAPRPDLANQWRYRATEVPKITGPGDAPAKKHDIRDFTPEIVGSDIHYSRGGDEISFVDRGRQVDVYDWQNRDTTLAALQLSAGKWGSFTVFGNDEYIAMCVRLAAERGFKIGNPELQERIAAERVKVREERTQAVKSAQAQQFERYHQAVNADRYRVTSTKVHADGTKTDFLLNKRDGVTKGFTPAEILRRMPEMQRMESRGENVCLTPLSDDKHHILIDGLSHEKLDQLITDGFMPATVIEVSPGSYQAIITIAKMGTPHDKAATNHVAKTLNKKYGDATLSGAIHAHRAPGFTNRKPAGQAGDASGPVVQMRKAQRQECPKTAALVVTLTNAYQAQEADKKARQPAPIDAADIDTSKISAVILRNAILAYNLHRPDILARQSGKANPSRVDSMIAVRMRLTGHSEQAILAGIMACAPIEHPDKKAYDWKDYATRTAAYAFSPKADQQLPGLQRYRGQWRKLEAQAQARRDKLPIEPVEAVDPAPSPAVPPAPEPMLEREPLQEPTPDTDQEEGEMKPP